MADAAVSTFTAVVTPAGTDTFYVVQGTSSKKATASQYGLAGGTFIAQIDGTNAAPAYSFTNNTNMGLWRVSNNIVALSASGSVTVQTAADDAGACVHSLWFGVNSGASGVTSQDTHLTRDGAANTLAQRNGTNAQVDRLYNTWTDASNYERLSFSWGSNICTITTQAAGTGTLRGLVIGGATTDLVAFHGSTAVVQRAGAAQAALAAYGTGVFGLGSDAAMSALHALVVEIRAALVEKGIIKGSA